MKLKVDVKQQQPAKVKPSRKNATAATRNKTDKRIAPPATGKRPGRKHYDSKQQQPAPPNVSEIRPGDGGRAFIKAFNQLVAAESLAIAKAVIAKVKLGDINGARFLDEIIGAKALRNQSWSCQTSIAALATPPTPIFKQVFLLGQAVFTWPFFYPNNTIPN